VGSIPTRATWPSGAMVDTRRSERRAFTGLGVRLSPWSLRSGLEPGFQHGLIRRPTPVRIRPPQLVGRVRKLAKRPGREPGERLWVRFPPRLLMGCWSNRTTPALHTGNEGATPSRSTNGRQPDTVGRAALLRRFSTEIRVRLPCLPLAAPMVKRTIIPRFERGVPGSNPGRGAVG
jgi:hypothetical protein